MYNAAESLLHDLQRLLDNLRKAGFQVSSADLPVLQHLLLHLPASNPEQNLARLQGMFGAVLCRNAEEQTQFPALFDDWLQSFDVKPEVVARVPYPAQITAVAENKSTSSWRYWVVFLLCSLLVGVGVFYWWTLPQTVDEKTNNPAQNQPIPDFAQPTMLDNLATPQTQEVKLEPTQASSWLWGLVAVPFVGVFLFWLIQRLNRRYLNRRLSNAQDFAHLQLSVPIQCLYQSTALRTVAQQLHRHELVLGRELDVPATIKQSLRNLGYFTPVQGQIQQRPEYLVLIDRASFADQQTALVDSLLQRMEDEGVVLTRWYFEHDPRYCYQVDSLKPYVLSDLSARYAAYRLLIFSSAHHFIDPVTRQAAAWVSQLDAWSQRAVFTLEPSNQWRYLQTLLAQADLLIAPATAQGLQQFISSVAQTKAACTDSPDYPTLLTRHSPHYWLQRLPSSQAIRQQLLQQLRRFLDEMGYLWLAACAVYPELHWRLTVYLGEQLKVLDEQRLARLTSLPWLRYGYLPNWLRLDLLESLSRKQKHQVQKLILNLLDKATIRNEKQKGAIGTILNIGKTNKKNYTDKVCVDFLAKNLGLVFYKLSIFKKAIWNSNFKSIFSPVSLKNIFVFGSGITLLLVMLGIITNAYTSMQQLMVKEAFFLTYIISLNSSAPLIYLESASIEETLFSLKANPYVNFAHIYDQFEEGIFASYINPNYSSNNTRQNLEWYINHNKFNREEKSWRFTNTTLNIMEPIFLNKNRIGTVYMQLSTNKLNQDILLKIIFELLVLLPSLLVAYLIFFVAYKINLKGVFIVISITFLVFLLIFIVRNDLSIARQNMIENIFIQTEITGYCVSAPLIYLENASVQETLESFNALPHIKVAYVFDQFNDVFARYIRNETSLNNFSNEQQNLEWYIKRYQFDKEKKSWRFTGTTLNIMSPIFLNENRIGTIYVQLDTTDLNQDLMQEIVIYIVIILLSLLFVFSIFIRTRQ